MSILSRINKKLATLYLRCLRDLRWVIVPSLCLIKADAGVRLLSFSGTVPLLRRSVHLPLTDAQWCPARGGRVGLGPPRAACTIRANSAAISSLDGRTWTCVVPDGTWVRGDPLVRTATLPVKVREDILERVENNTVLLYKKKSILYRKTIFAIFSVKITKTTNIVKTPYI